MKKMFFAIILASAFSLNAQAQNANTAIEKKMSQG
jgi:type II secretory pathway component PulJ